MHVPSFDCQSSQHPPPCSPRSGSAGSTTAGSRSSRQGGNERAFEVLDDCHHRALLGFCRHMLRSGDEAEDALQQTLLRAHRALVTHGAPTDPRPWLYTIARNHCQHAARRSSP